MSIFITITHLLGKQGKLTSLIVKSVSVNSRYIYRSCYFRIVSHFHFSEIFLSKYKPLCLNITTSCEIRVFVFEAARDL